MRRVRSRFGSTPKITEHFKTCVLDAIASTVKKKTYYCQSVENVKISLPCSNKQTTLLLNDKKYIVTIYSIVYT